MLLQGLEETPLASYRNTEVYTQHEAVTECHVIKSHEIKNVTDFNVADSVRRDIKVLVTKTRYTVYIYNIYIYIYIYITVLLVNLITYLSMIYNLAIMSANTSSFIFIHKYTTMH